VRYEDEPANTPPPVPISDAVEHLLTARGLEATAVLAEVLGGWDETVGRDVAAHVVPVAVRQGGELVVEVDEPAWATQVQLLSSLLLARLADQLGPSAPHRLSVKVGRPRRQGGTPVAPPRDGARNDAKIRPTMPGRTPPTR